jgi:putative nucleotidyltransferase with HDIG domain
VLLEIKHGISSLIKSIAGSELMFDLLAAVADEWTSCVAWHCACIGLLAGHEFSLIHLRVSSHLKRYNILGISPKRFHCFGIHHPAISTSFRPKHIKMTVAPFSTEETNAREKVRTLFLFIEAQGQGDYIGEAISQLDHSLQAAALAKIAGSDDDTILGALLHDIGRFIPSAGDMPKMIAPDGTFVGTETHEIAGEKYLRSIGFSDKICQIVGAHVWAKRYLTATVEGYWEALSKSSKVSLEFQVCNQGMRRIYRLSLRWQKGGRFNDDQIREAQKDPLLEQKLAVRRWDDQAKVLGAVVPQLDAYDEMAVQSLLRSCYKA